MYPEVIRLIQKRDNLVFVDEAVFSSNQIRARYWAKAGDAALVVDKAKIGFKAIAVVAAINLKGEVVEVMMREKSICHPDFEAFLYALKNKMRSRKTHIFLDNLRIHHMIST